MQNNQSIDESVDEDEENDTAIFTEKRFFHEEFQANLRSYKKTACLCHCFVGQDDLDGGIIFRVAPVRSKKSRRLSTVSICVTESSDDGESVQDNPPSEDSSVEESDWDPTIIKVVSSDSSCSSDA